MTTLAATGEPPVLDCEQTVRRLWDYLDHQLSPLETEAVAIHLRDCRAKCASHFEFEHAFLQLLRSSVPRPRASDAMRDRVRHILELDEPPPPHPEPTHE